MTQTKTVAVTGATGFVGRYIVRDLLARGHRVRALVRDTSKAREALPQGNPSLQLVSGSIFEPGVAAELVKGADACINLIGIIREVRGDSPKDVQTFERMHVNATKAIVDACVAGGLKRFIQMSALGASSEGKAAYQKTKHLGEQIVRRSGLDWTIFRPSLIHGAEGEFVQMVSDMASGQQPPWYFIPYFARQTFDQRVPLGGPIMNAASVQPISVEDVSKAFAEALDRPNTIGEIYNLVGPDPMTWPEVLAFFRDTLPGASHKMPVSPVPGMAAVVGAKVAKALGLASLLPFDEGQARMAMEDSTSELAKVRDHLGLTPKPFKETVRSYAARV